LITSESKGCRHFEPLGNYEEAHLKLEPGKRNDGISFGNRCNVDDLIIGN